MEGDRNSEQEIKIADRQRSALDHLRTPLQRVRRGTASGPRSTYKIRQNTRQILVEYAPVARKMLAKMP
ncbi:hypothetical protein RSSM_01521 [Rhodopirellula sallentina SM41]|uniref:Uncharacterized protein n=1 Tax=Rhodopirellula sallentina SM41 TaxID=1263870 RepID=M5U697_9BACT|nr:hypothetical protein RSSM_01521 [Rhodopirellula sallentina SM41]